MKRLLLLVIMLSSIQMYPQWYWQNPLPQGNILWSVKFTSLTVGWTVGQAGQVFVETKKMVLLRYSAAADRRTSVDEVN